MPFVLKKYPVKANNHQKIQHYLTDHCNFSISLAQKLVSKARVFDEDGKRYGMSQKVYGNFIQVAVFQGITKGLKPIFQTTDFAFFDKPSGIMVHPTSKNTQYSLLDEIRYHFGDDANLAHRIDLETSGLVLVTKNKYSDMILKDMFENKLYKKEYLAIVNGKIDKTIEVDAKIKKDTTSPIGVKMTVANDGKESFTTIVPLKYDTIKNQTLIKAIPLTGRQHQIRVHTHYIGHTIVGDPIYGMSDYYADLYLTKQLSLKKRVELTKANRLMLHSNYLEFNYNKINYQINSKLSLK